MSPFTTGLNTPNGLVKLNSGGTVPPALINTSSAIGGMYNVVVDAVDMFNVTPNNGVDQSAALQNAFNYVGNAGGGIVYIGPGTFSLANPVYLSSYTWLQMSPHTVLQRMPGSPNPPYILSNIQFNSSGTPGTNIRITGGLIDARGTYNLTTPCTMIELFQGTNHWIDTVYFYSPASNSHAIELNGVAGIQLSNLVFDGVETSSAPQNSAVLINSSVSATSPTGLSSGLYNGSNCYGVTLINCNVIPTLNSNYSAYGCLLGSEIANSNLITAYDLTVSSSSFTALASNPPIYSGNAVWTQCMFTGNSWGDGMGIPNANITVPYDSWVKCTLNSGFSSPSGNYPLQYRVAQDGIVTVFGMVTLPGSGYNNTITTIPYHPTYAVYDALASIPGSVDAVYTRVDASGHLTLQQAQAGGVNVFINMNFPADYAGNGPWTG